jgi:hypothetical protein
MMLERAGLDFVSDRHVVRSKMKTVNYSLILLMMLLAPFARAVEFNAVEDATIKNGASASSNFGSDTTVWGYNQSGIIYKSYIKFDVSSLGGDIVTDINSIQAYWYDQAYDRGASVYLVTNTAYMNWSESTITWDNAPGSVTNSQYLVADAGILLGSFDVPSPAASGTVSLNWTTGVVGGKSVLMDMMNHNDYVTLVIVRPTDRWVSFASTEAVDASHPLRINAQTESLKIQKLFILSMIPNVMTRGE